MSKSINVYLWFSWIYWLNSENLFLVLYLNINFVCLGQFIVLAGLRSMSGTLEFVDTQDFTIMNTGEHFMATNVEWDPTGRYVATAVSWWGHKVDYLMLKSVYYVDIITD